jgi:uncharacterized membrane protein YebE (DUF533 family)
MNISDVVGQLLREGVSPATQQRVQHAMGQDGLGGTGAGGLGDILGSILGDSSGAGGPTGTGESGVGDLLGGLGNVLSADSGVGGLSRGQVGGIGAVAGALLGGGGGAIKGAIGGSAMALLGTLAISALKNWQAQAGSTSEGSAAQAVSAAEIKQMTAPETAELCLRGMIEAVKSDGQIAPEEVERIVGKLEEGGISAEEKRFVTEQMRRPADVRGLAAAIPNREVGAQVYAAALMAISVDTQAERAFLSELGRGAGLDGRTLQQLHAMVGAPSPSA